MSKITEQPGVQNDGQRQALERAEKKAAERQPGSFKEEANDDKVVEVGHDLTDAPIKGIDPAPERPRGQTRETRRG
jgi:hypothetical protein